MKCLVCAGEARDRTPRNFDGYVIECPSCGKCCRTLLRPRCLLMALSALSYSPIMRSAFGPKADMSPPRASHHALTARIWRWMA